jgi:hypothetical protein
MNLNAIRRTAIRQSAHHARTLALLAALLIGAVGFGAYAPDAIGHDDEADPATAEVVGQDCADTTEDGLAEEAFVRTELFFGTAKPDGTAVTQAEWIEFLDSEITARFPDGLTVMTGIGQWQGEDEEIIQERSILVILLYPREAVGDGSAKIEAIRTAYEQEFSQESVLRASDSLPVCVSF